MSKKLQCLGVAREQHLPVELKSRVKQLAIWLPANIAMAVLLVHLLESFILELKLYHECGRPAGNARDFRMYLRSFDDVPN